MTRIRNTKTERVHRALAGYVRPKLKPGANVEFTPAFAGIDDSNLMDNISHIAAAAMRLTATQLAFDASPHELSKTLRDAATKSDDGSEIEESVVEKLLALLEHKLLPTELMAVRDILMKPAKGKSAVDPGAQTAEDAKNAQVAFDQRFPSAKRIGFEPAMTPETKRYAEPSPSDYAKRFPSAMRIGQA